MVAPSIGYPEVSAVIPLYNKRPYIMRAVESVSRQTFPPAEILIVDDGSTDGGGKAVDHLLSSRVKLIRQENSGECAARNRGIAEAKYPLVAFLDADDEWKPDFMAVIQRLISNFPDCGAYATSAEIIRRDGTVVCPRLGQLPPEPWIGIIPNFFELFQEGYAFNASSIAVPRKVLDGIGGFPDGATISGDVACWVKIAMRHPIAFSPTHSVIYHQDAENRVGNVFKPLVEMPYIETIREAKANGVLSGELAAAAVDFAAQKQIMVAAENVMTGNPGKALTLLSTCHRTRKYRRAWLRWRFWAALPAGWPKVLLNLKQALLGQAS